MATSYICVRGARANNLRDLSVDIPRNQLVVVTGLSGSGKSSLAFDTLFAEGRRRYLDTLSPYAKYFMGTLEKPDVEEITGLSPVIAIGQKTTSAHPRSTVGTVTEILDFLRLLFAKVSHAFSPDTGKEMVRYTDAQIVELLLSHFAGRKCYLLAPLVHGRKGHYRELLEKLRRRGYTQVRVDGEIVDLEGMDALDRYKVHFIDLVVDRMKPEADDPSRVRESVARALEVGKGAVSALDAETGELAHYSRHWVDPDTGRSFQQPQPHTFSFNSPQGYCPHCKGLGMVANLSREALIPDPGKSIAQGALAPLGRLRENRASDIVRAIALRHRFSLHDPVSELPDEVVDLLLYGSDDLFRIGEGERAELVSWDGLTGQAERTTVCPVCQGTRLKAEARCFRVDGKDIAQVCAMELTALGAWLDQLEGKLSPRERAIAHDMLGELKTRVGFLLDVGLEYLSLDRPTASLSGGESQRIRLATQIGSKLVHVLYILDEPSIGLHQRDNRKLIASLKALRDAGNSILVVEHDADTMLQADWLVDIGPGAGVEGGRLCLNAPVGTLLRGEPLDAETAPHAVTGNSLTLDYLAGRRKIAVPARRRPGNGQFLRILGARGNNLKEVDFALPLGCLVGVAGVSGSGKSTLVRDTLAPLLKAHCHHGQAQPLPYRSVEGLEQVDKLIEIDQSPIGRTPRSNPATFTGAFDDIRQLFGQTPDAKVRGLRAGHFSFNVPGGRCEECKGAGAKVIEMNFLPSVHVPCEACAGKRYKEDTLSVRYKGRSIAEVLDMTIDEAYAFFRPIPKLAAKLRALVEVGLGYVRLGQSALTLSGGESQRMKLAAELSRTATGKTLYILDEPTTGLHFEDIRVLLDALHRLVDAGNTVLVIEHNLDVLRSVDYLFDLGPGGGKAGGRIIAQGTPEEVAANPASVTGPYLAEQAS